MEIKLKPIRVVHSPFKKKEDIPRERYASADGFDDIEGEIEIFNEYEPGLKDKLKKHSRRISEDIKSL